MRLLLSLLLLSALSGPARAEPPLRMLVTETGALIHAGADGVSAEGAAIDLLKKILDKAQMQASLEIVPPARKVDGARHQMFTCALSIQRVPDNENSFKWAGPVSRDQVHLFGAADFAGTIKGIADIQRYTVGAVRGSVTSRTLRDMGLRVDEAVNLQTNVRKLLAGRVTLIPLGSIEREALRDLPEARQIKQVFKMLDQETWIACNPSVSSASMQRLQRTIEAAKRAGQMRFLGF